MTIAPKDFQYMAAGDRLSAADYNRMLDEILRAMRWYAAAPLQLTQDAGGNTLMLDTSNLRDNLCLPFPARITSTCGHGSGSTGEAGSVAEGSGAAGDCVTILPTDTACNSVPVPSCLQVQAEYLTTSYAATSATYQLTYAASGSLGPGWYGQLVFVLGCDPDLTIDLALICSGGNWAMVLGCGGTYYGSVFGLTNNTSPLDLAFGLPSSGPFFDTCLSACVTEGSLRVYTDIEYSEPSSGSTGSGTGSGPCEAEHAYAWEEMENTGCGAFQPKSGGRTGTCDSGTAFEISGNPNVPFGTLVWLSPSCDGRDEYIFSHCCGDALGRPTPSGSESTGTGADGTPCGDLVFTDLYTASADCCTPTALPVVDCEARILRLRLPTGTSYTAIYIPVGITTGQHWIVSRAAMSPALAWGTAATCAFGYNEVATADLCSFNYNFATRTVAPYTPGPFDTYSNCLEAFHTHVTTATGKWNMMKWTNSNASTVEVYLYNGLYKGAAGSDVWGCTVPTADCDPAGCCKMTDLELYLPFEDGTGTTASDESGNNRDGTLSGTASWSSTVPSAAPCEGSYSLGLAAVNDEVEVADVADLRFANGDTLSLSLWFRITDWDSETSVLLTKGDEYTQINYMLRVENILGVPGKAIDFLWTNADSTYNLARISTTLSLDTWYHVAVTHTFGSASTVMYLNGSSQSVVQELGSQTAAPQTPTNPLRIGWAQFPALPTHQTIGQIDDVRVYRAILSAAEVECLAGV